MQSTRYSNRAIGFPPANRFGMRSRGNILVFGAPTAIALWFVYTFAAQYFSVDAERYGIYWPRHQWLYAHIISGMAALLLGPAQLWLGLNRRTKLAHRILGSLYVAGALVSATAAVYLAVHTDFGWVSAAGFTSMAAAWIITTGFALIAVLMRRPEQHREWMVRSYVVTFGFVIFRVLDGMLDLANIGTIVERRTAASWLAWTVPLLLTEVIMQGWKMFARPASVRALADANACTAAPGPTPFVLQNSESLYQRRP